MKNLMAFLVACSLAAATPFFSVSHGHAIEQRSHFPGWLKEWEGRRLQPLPFTEREKRFAAGFPGKIARFTDGRRQFIFCWVSRTTRQLHPASDCFRGSGYSVRPMPLRRDREGEGWGCFEAARGGETLRVCERIFDNAGNTWTDVSSWYWAAALGGSEGPWWAVTRVE